MQWINEVNNGIKRFNITSHYYISLNFHQEFFQCVVDIRHLNVVVTMTASIVMTEGCEKTETA